VVWGGNQFVTVGDDGMIQTSPDGSTWAVRDSGATSDLRGIAWSGRQFVAVGAAGVILTSIDAVTWARRGVATTSNLYGVAWSGSGFVVAGADGTILVSSNGTDWIQRQSGTTRTLRSVTWGNSLFVAVGDSGEPLISRDGLDWTAHYASVLPLYDVVWSGAEFVAVGPGLSTGALAVCTSSDGVTWLSRSLPEESYPYAITWTGSQFVTVGSAGMIMTSADGRTWSARWSGPSSDLNAVAWSGRQFVAVGGRSAVLTSVDGTSWTSRSTGTTVPLLAVAWGSKRFVATGERGTLLSSEDGINWIGRTSGTIDALNAVTWGRDLFVVVGDAGILTSADGMNWVARTPGTTQILYGVAWSGQRLVAVGANGMIVTSENGVDWATVSSSTPLTLTAVSWGGEQFVAVGVAGTILTSSDGLTWTTRTSGTTSLLKAVAYNGSRYVAAGAGTDGRGILLTSADAVTWSNRTAGPFRRLQGVGCGGRRFVAVGQLGAIITADAPAITVQPQSHTTAIGASARFTVAADGMAPLTLQWRRDGLALSGATASALTFANVQVSDAGLYSLIASNNYGDLESSTAILGVSSTLKVSGAGDEIEKDILHPSGNTFDQVLVTGAAVAITADWVQGQVTRTSFIDLDDDIVQVEFSGPGTLSLVLDGYLAPALPLNYNQPVNYAKGHAGIVITGADERTNVSVFTVGRATAFDRTGAFNILLPISETNKPANNGSPLFDGHATTTYDGIADIAFIAITSTNGKFGGVRTANVNYFGRKGITGVYAPGVTFAGPLRIGDITAFDSAVPVIVTESVADALITGGDLFQENGQPVSVSGLSRLAFVDGSTSGGRLLTAQPNRAVLEREGLDVTDMIVVNPPE
jgi:hypothetical protein